MGTTASGDSASLLRPVRGLGKTPTTQMNGNVGARRGWAFSQGAWPKCHLGQHARPMHGALGALGALPNRAVFAGFVPVLTALTGS
jgi:hypothetical protein